MSIWILTSIIIIELNNLNVNSSKNKLIKFRTNLQNIINYLFSILTNPIDLISETVNLSLQTIATYSKKIHKIAPFLINKLVNDLCLIIIKYLNKVNSNNNNTNINNNNNNNSNSNNNNNNNNNSNNSNSNSINNNSNSNSIKNTNNADNENSNFNKLGFNSNNNNKETQQIPIIPNFLPYIIQTITDFIMAKSDLLFDNEINKNFFKMLFMSLGVNNSKKRGSRSWKVSNELLNNSIELNQKKNFFSVFGIKEKKELIKNITKEDISICLSDLISATKKRNSQLKKNQKSVHNKSQKSSGNNNSGGGNNNDQNNSNNSGNNKDQTDENLPLIFHLSYDLLNAAEILLYHLMIHWKNYPLCEIPEIINSSFPNDQIDIPNGYLIDNKGKNDETKNDESNGDTLLNFHDYSQTFSLKETSILTLFDIPLVNKKTNEKKTLVRIILRDITGKYVWDFENIYLSDLNKLAPNNNLHLNSNTNDKLMDHNNYENYLTNKGIEITIEKEKGKEKEIEIEKKIEIEIKIEKEKEKKKHNTNYINTDNNKKYMRRRGTLSTAIDLPKRKSGTEKTPNMLSEMLEYIGESFQLKENQLNKPSLAPYTQIQSLNNIYQSYTIQHNQLLVHVSNNQNKGTGKFCPCKPKTAKKSKSHWKQSRLIISQLGFISIEDRQDLTPLKRSDRLERTLKELDKRPSREVQKIGVIYVAAGQTEQNEILANEAGSPLYEEFVNSLGWEVDLKNHLGFVGGLDTYNDTNGKTAPFFADYQTEVIFHVLTRMPNSKTDIKQIHKKKHVGNDIVQIIWSENTEQDYNPKTITSKFNFAHIVIYPLPNGLFRIQIHMKNNVKFFGPLITGMIVNKQSLPYLVRKTAILANRLLRYSQKGYEHPYPTRWNLLTETIEKYKTNLSFVDYYSSIIHSKHSEKSMCELFESYQN